ncbi:MAG: putative bifunctional diguanylate cyclase/phosphodiesterase, partial [Thiohalorhabdaceae bacterium]
MGNGGELHAVRKDGSRFLVEIGLSWFGEGSDRRTVASVVETTQRLEAERELYRLVYEDSLTGLLSGRGFHDRLTGVLSQPGAADPLGYILQLDVQNLNDFNEAYGYPAGDALLQNIGKRLHQALHGGEFAARVWADQFAVFLDAREHGLASEDDARRWAVQQLEAPFDIQGRGIRVGFFWRHSRRSQKSQRGRYLYPSQRAGPVGGSQVDRFPLVHLHRRAWEAVRQRVTTTEGLRSALEQGHLALFYQPQVILADNRVAGSEALMRWRDPERGLQSPGTFMSVAEQSQLILPMGEWALHQACSHIRHWRERGWTNCRAAVNIAVSQLTQTDLAATVETILADSGVAPDRLTLEITESMFANEHGVLLAQMERLKALGVRLALDDFGTGYSSLNYLHRFPFDEIKTDKAFVQNSLSHGYSREIVRLVAEVAGVLDA